MPGYDYDTITEEAILTRAEVKDGRIVLPDGMSYRVLVLPEHRAISLAVLRKVEQMVRAGAVVVGPRPVEASGLFEADANDREVTRIADALWGKGLIAANKTAREVLAQAGVAADFEVVGGDTETDLDYIHRRDGEAEIYFVANRGAEPRACDAFFASRGNDRSCGMR